MESYLTPMLLAEVKLIIGATNLRKWKMNQSMCAFSSDPRLLMDQSIIRNQLIYELSMYNGMDNFIPII